MATNEMVFVQPWTETTPTPDQGHYLLSDGSWGSPPLPPMLQTLIDTIREQNANRPDLLVFADWLEEKGGDLEPSLQAAVMKVLRY